MDATWPERGSGIKYLPHSIWVFLLVLPGVILGQALVGWFLTAFVAFLIYPRFWESREAQGKRGFAGARMVIAVMFSIFMAYGAWGWLNGQQPHDAVDASDDANTISVAEAVVKSSLRDPDSAQFLGEHVVRLDANTQIVCGLVNSKNGFGGMAGYDQFMVNGMVVQFGSTTQDLAYMKKVCG